MTQLERRDSARKSPEQLGYISLPADNGGIVLDLSEGGLCFHSVAPIVEGKSIHFRFTVNTITRIEAVGELAWKDETGRTGGLKFTQISDEIRQLIREWSGEPKMGVAEVVAPEPVVKTKPIPAPEPVLESTPEPVPDSTPVSVRVPVVEAEGTPAKEDAPAMNVISNPAPPKLQPTSRPTTFASSTNSLSMFSLGTDSGSWPLPASTPPSVSSRHPVAALVLMILLACIVGIGIFAYASTSRVGESLVHRGERVLGRIHRRLVSSEPAVPAGSRQQSPTTTQQ